VCSAIRDSEPASRRLSLDLRARFDESRALNRMPFHVPEEAKRRMANLTEVYVNIIGTGQNVLKDGTGECEDELITCAGTVVPPGPVTGKLYVVGSKTKIYYDTTCISGSSGYYSFRLRPGDSC
jgi:hypothetical protein